jgi:hypothetical protein
VTSLSSDWGGDYPGHDVTGLGNFTERTLSYALAADNTNRSAKAFPTICKPTGKPDVVKPQGIVSAGCPVTLKG